MKIWQAPSYDRFPLFDAERKTKDSGSTHDVFDNGNVQADKVVISDEGMTALREKLKEVKPEAEEPVLYELTVQDTNEVEWEHYTAMREYSSLSLKDENYNVEDLMKSIVDAYEARYNQIVKAHENGNRQVSYDLTGDTEVTLEEDLTGLDRAYKRCLANLEGYIVCQQTKDGAKFFKSTDMKREAAERKEYRDTAVTMMEKARKKFLKMCENPDSKEGAAKSIIWNIMSKNTVFMDKTRKLFAKTVYYNAFS